MLHPSASQCNYCEISRIQLSKDKKRVYFSLTFVSLLLNEFLFAFFYVIIYLISMSPIAVYSAIRITRYLKAFLNWWLTLLVVSFAQKINFLISAIWMEMKATLLDVVCWMLSYFSCQWQNEKNLLFACWWNRNFAWQLIIHTLDKFIQFNSFTHTHTWLRLTDSD